jgi:sugar transferase (PEP-CTERM system associated)
MLTVVGRQIRTRTVILILCEHALIVGAVALGAWIRLGDDVWTAFADDHGIAKTVLIAGVAQICLYYADLYDLRALADRRELFTGIVQALGATSLVLAALYFWLPALIVGRGVFLVSAAIVIGVVAGWRLAFEWLAHRVRPRERLLMVGTSPGAIALARELFDRRQALGVDIVGFVDPDPARVGEPLFNPAIIGTIDDIATIVRTRNVDRVVVSLADARGKLPMQKLLDIKLEQGVQFDHIASVYEEYTGKIAIESLRPSWLVFSSGFRKTAMLRAAKRTLDVLTAAAGLIIATPVLLVVALLVKVTSRGPVLYHQQRVGQHGRIFTVHKFRSMRADAEAKTGAVWAASNDSRVTPIGRLLRKSRLDELPQLWNVLRGEMSFVGPRPERPEFVRQLTEQIPYYGQRHVVRPGLTGWAQVRYSYGASTEDALQKLQYDLYYIKNLSISLDLFIIFSTIKTVVLRKGT